MINHEVTAIVKTQTQIIRTTLFPSPRKTQIHGIFHKESVIMTVTYKERGKESKFNIYDFHEEEERELMP